MRNIKHHLFKQVKQIKHLVKPLTSLERFVHKNVPYFCQWESRELAKQIYDKTISTDDDPNWKASGAKTKREYHDWSWSGCGMACTKMIMAYRSGDVMPLATLGKKCAEYGGYTMPLEKSIGLLYKPFVTFVDKEFGWKARVIQGATVPELVHELGKGNFVIAGVSPMIRDTTSKPRVKGGHLVLLVGYDKVKQEIYLHNPSGFTKKTQEYAAVSFADFHKFFSGRGIVVQGGPSA